MLRQKLAAVQHEIWADWMRYLFQVSELNDDGTYTISEEKARRWIRQLNTPYSKLSEDEQRSDLELADRILSIIDVNCG